MPASTLRIRSQKGDVMQPIICRLQEHVLEIELNRADKANAINTSMYQALVSQLLEAESNPNIHVVLLTGKACCFTSGMDLNELIDPELLSEHSVVMEFLRTVAMFSKPLMAAVNGPAIGIGTTLLLHCDIVYAGKSAVFQLPFVNLGLVPEFASTLLLPKQVGFHLASQWLLLGEAFSAEEAQKGGLVSHVYDDEAYHTAAMQKAVELASRPTAAVIATKALLKSNTQDSIAAVMNKEIEQFSDFLMQSSTRQLIAKNLLEQ